MEDKLNYPQRSLKMFQKLSIKSKLIFSFIGVLFLFLGTAIYNLFGLNEIQHSVNDIVNDRIPKILTLHETKIPTEIPKKHSTEEQERSHKMPVGKNEDEDQQEEMDASFDDKKSNKKDVE